MSLSTHVLNAVTGRPAAGVAIHLETFDGTPVAGGTTDADGRVADLAADLAVGDYRLRFDTAAYFAGRTFYPEVSVAFTVREPDVHLHVPLLLSPYAYSTYRGS